MECVGLLKEMDEIPSNGELAETFIDLMASFRKSVVDILVMICEYIQAATVLMRSFDLVASLVSFLSIRLIATIICHEEPEKLRNRITRKKEISEVLLRVVQTWKDPEFVLIREVIWDLLDYENLMMKLDDIGFFNVMLRRAVIE
jgi:hypothetical protein